MDRLRYLRKLWAERVLTAWLGAAWTILGIVQFGRDELFKQDWKFGPYALEFGGWGWAAVLALLLLMWVFEASFRLHRRESADVARLTDELQSKIRLTYSTESAIDSTDGVMSLLLFVSVENIGNVPLTNCHVRTRSHNLKHRESPMAALHSWQDACPPFSLVIGDRKLVPIIALSHAYEAIERDKAEMVAFQPGKDAGGPWIKSEVTIILPASDRFTVWVEALSADSRPTQLSLDVYYDKSWQTRLRD